MKNKLMILIICLCLISSIFAQSEDQGLEGLLVDGSPTGMAVPSFYASEKVTFGYDIDTNKFGFRNMFDAKLTLNISNPFSVKTTDKSFHRVGIWGEIDVGVDGDILVVKEGQALGNGTSLGFKLKKAKLHIYDLYIDITPGNTLVGALKLKQSLQSDRKHNVEYPATFQLSGFGASLDGTFNQSEGNNIYQNYDQGITFGGEFEYVGFDIDVRTGAPNKAQSLGDDQNTDKYWSNLFAVATELRVMPTENLTIKVGGASNIPVEGKLPWSIGWAGSVGYAIPLYYDLFSLEPQFGYAGTRLSKKEQKYDANSLRPLAEDDKLSEIYRHTFVAGVLFSWDKESETVPNIPYFNYRDVTKVIPGVSIQARFNLPQLEAIWLYRNNGQPELYKELSGYNDPSFSSPSYEQDNQKAYNLLSEIPLSVSVFSGDLFRKVQFAMLFDARIGLPSTYRLEYAKRLSAADLDVIKSVPAPDFAFATLLGASYTFRHIRGNGSIVLGGGLMYMNASYNNLGSKVNPLFYDAGEENRRVYRESRVVNDKKVDPAFTAKLSIDFDKIIPQTAFGIIYESKNFLNTTEYKDNPLEWYSARKQFGVISTYLRIYFDTKNLK